MRRAQAFAFALLLLPGAALAQFRDDFDPLRIDPSGARGWRFRTGEGEATMALEQREPGVASVLVDATADRRNVWWALIQREVHEGIDLSLLSRPGREVRIEARIRSSHAPRRVNLQVQTQRTTDYHSHLMEFDIPRAGVWETISMTTHGFDARPGDTLIAHMALMDWGRSTYRVDVDYIDVRIVDVATAPSDRGTAVPYHPRPRDPETFAISLPAAADATIDLDEPTVSLGDWGEQDDSGRIPLLGVGSSRVAILRWDLAAYAGRRAKGSGLLVLTTRSVHRKAEPLADFGLLRAVEILGGDPRWDEGTVAAGSFLRGEPAAGVLNPQMIVDWPASEGDGAPTLLTIPRPVLQRMIDGATRGLALTPLGALSAAFYAREAGSRTAPRLLFDLE